MNFKILVYSFFILLLFNGYIFADVINFDSLQEAISSEEFDKKYSFSGTQVIEKDLGQMLGNYLTIEGTQKDSVIVAKESLKYYGIIITETQNLVLNNISGFNGFTTAIETLYGSSVTVKNTVFYNNICALKGSGVAFVTVNNTIFNNNRGELKGSAIYNKGYLEVNNSTFSLNSSSYGGALINIYGEASLNNVWFENNSAKTGGAILNDVFNGIMHINNVIFSNNVATGVDGKYGGGAIKNKNILTITGNSLFNDNESGISGGAIENRFHASLNINGFIEFVENKASSVGGAIYNCENSSATISGEKIIFSSNSAGNAGGAIFNNDNSKMAIGSDSGSTIFFSSNTATGSAGGAICNFEKSEIAIKGEKIIFSSNTAQTAGGAIDNTQSIMIISGENIIFSSNTAGDAGGGAIFNYKMISSSTMTITGKNVVFNYNIATSSGGAIYNEGSIINLLSTGNIEFTGNKANEISNAIHDVGGIINLSASDNAKIIFNDRITTENSNSILNINQSTSTLNAIGTIVLNEDMSGYTGQVNLYNGEIELQSNTLDTSNVNTNKFFNGDITLSSGTLNILNNSIDNIKIDSLTSTANANLKFDVDLSNNTSDNFTVLDTASGELNLTAINILGVNRDNGQITLFNDEKSPALNILTTANYGGYEYTFTNSSDTLGVLNYEQTGTTRTFKEVVNDVVPGYRSYSLAGNETVIEDLGDLGGTLLTIFGNGKNIEGNNVDGIYIASGQILNIEKVNNYSGFTGINGALKNEGILNISGTNFSGNVNQDIINNGNLKLSGLASSFEKGIVGIGTTTIVGIDIDLNDANIEQSKIEITENGSLKTSATNVVGDIENDGILIFNGGTNNNKISGEGTLVVNDSILNYAGISQKNINITNGFFSNYASEDITVATLRVEVNAVLYENGYNGGKVNAINVYNDGFISIIQSDITNISDYQGGGDLILTETNFINNANIMQSTITINDASSLITNADKIHAGAILNEGTLTLTGGENSNYIVGKGTTTVDGSLVNNAVIANNVIVKEEKELTTSATNIVGDITNNGLLIIKAGEENGNKITGSGDLKITASNITNDNVIEQRVITITKGDNSQGNSEEQNKFVNNSNISAEELILKNVSLKITQKGELSVENLFAENAEIDLVNSRIRNYNFKEVRLESDLNLSVDADLANKQMDTITANDYDSNNGKINVKAINILSDATEKRTEIMFTSSTVLKDKISTIKTASSDLYKYDINYNNGYFIFSRNGTNPVIAESQVATAVGGTITQTAVLNQAFVSIDSVIQDRYINYYEASNHKNMKKTNLYASTADLLYSEDTNTIEKGLWIRPYAIQDTININNLSVDNTAIGTLAGLDLSVWENSLLSFYIGYAGSTQKYENIKINQIGYVVGTTGMIIKDYYYLGLTANINFNKTQSENDNGTDELDMNMYSVGAKAGYNIYLGEKLILEPNLTLMYGKINSSEYTTKISNKKIGSQSTNNILIEPQIKAKLDLAKGWTPYTLLGYVLNAGEKTKLIVDNSSFDDMDMQITGYTEYGIGVTKSFKYSAWSCSLQIVGKSGNREGFGSNLEIKYRF